MHKIMSKMLFYFLLTMMLAISLNTVVFAAPPAQKGEEQQDNDNDNDNDADVDDSDDNDNDNDNDNVTTQPVAQPQVGDQSTFTQGGQPVGPQQGDQQSTFTQGSQPVGPQQGGFQQGQQGQDQQDQFGQQGMMASSTCAQVYTVQAGDTLGDIANRFLGSIESYQLIVDATNTAAGNNQQVAFQQSSLQQDQQGSLQQGTDQGATQQGTNQGTSQQQQGTDQGTLQQGTDQGTTQQQETDQGTMQQGTNQGAAQQQQGTDPGTMQQGANQGAMQQGQQVQQQSSSGFSRIDDPNLITAGQTLCIPSSQQTLAQQDQQGAMPQDQQSQQSGAFQQTENQNQQGLMGDLFSVPPGKSKILLENLGLNDLVIDISQGPTPQSVWVGPGQRQILVVDPGVYTFMGHRPAEEFGLIPGELQLAPDSFIGIACSDSSQCQAHSDQQLMTMMDNTSQNVGQTTDQGTMQQGTNQPQPAPSPATPPQDDDDDDDDNDNESSNDKGSAG